MWTWSITIIFIALLDPNSGHGKMWLQMFYFAFAVKVRIGGCIVEVKTSLGEQFGPRMELGHKSVFVWDCIVRNCSTSTLIKASRLKSKM